MIKAYFNYPNSLVTVHRNPNCPQAKLGPGESVRHVILNADTISGELRKFEKLKHGFGPEAGHEDMYLIVDFFDAEFEEALVAYLRKRLGRHFQPFRSGELKVHC